MSDVNYTINIRSSFESVLEERGIALSEKDIDEMIENINTYLEDEFDQRIDFELGNLGYM